MKWIIITLLLLPVAQATIFLEEITVEEENVSLHLNISGFLTWTCEEIIIQENTCDNFSFTGLPASITSGEKLSFGFTDWQENDSVTYWVEDLQGNILKDEYTTTSKTKKSYTPKLEGEERAIIFKATRTRDACEDTFAEQLVVVFGEPVICEEQEEIVASCEEMLEPASLYVRAKHWQENITLYGKVEEAGMYILFGEETPQRIVLENGGFSLVILPKKGDNTYGLVAEKGGIPLLTSFNLSFKEANSSSLNGTFTVIPPLATGEVILENKTTKNTSIIAGLVGAGLVFSGLKTKLLRRKHDSV